MTPSSSVARPKSNTQARMGNHWQKVPNSIDWIVTIESNLEKLTEGQEIFVGADNFVYPVRR